MEVGGGDKAALIVGQLKICFGFTFLALKEMNVVRIEIDFAKYLRAEIIEGNWSTDGNKCYMFWLVSID